MLFNTIGSTNPPSDITNAKLWYTGGTSSFDPTIATLVNTFVAPWATNYTFAGNFTGLQHGDNYFWITYDIPLAATSGNFVDAEWVNFGYRIIRTGTSGTIGTSVINVGSGTGFVVGAAISGTGIPGGSTISAVGATTITISSVLTASPPSVNAVLTSTPTVQTLPGNREIDVIYCIPQYFVGTSWLGYNTNDYIAQVIMAGNPTAPPGINNSLNSVGPNAGGCFGGPCPFSTHPPDYELFPAVPGKTAAITADGLTVYPISLKVGTYCCANYIAAFIDFNKDGDFTDLGERIAQSGSLSNGQTYATTFVVPITATTGTTRMRVREVWIQPNIDPCNAATYGETEDYVITILPTCGVPGWRTWLGFTDDWDNPSNWCGGVPTLADNARLPGSGGPGYTRPVIKTGVFATTRKLRVEPNDTLYIKAWTNSTLTVADSMYIQGNTSMVKVSSTLIDTAQVFNGLLLPSNSLTPLKNSGKARSFWVFTQAELLARGLVAGDAITDVLLHLNRLVTNSQSYRNVTIKYYYTTPAFVFVPGVGSVIPPVVTVGATIHTTAN
ncbi:MAG: hypothetical protein IPP71_15535 [Bacteroidetes bacterium]|nr:hypothetical protein [Bacteroidota bacterium]